MSKAEVLIELLESYYSLKQEKKNHEHNAEADWHLRPHLVRFEEAKEQFNQLF